MTRKIGFYLTEKKIRRLNIEEFGRICSQHDIELISIDLKRDIVPQGPFEVVFFKLTTLYGAAVSGCKLAQTQIDNLKTYLRNHQDIVVLDPFENSSILQDRYLTYKFINRISIDHKLWGRCPPFVRIKETGGPTVYRKRIQEARILFPFISKSVYAQGTPNAHSMAIVFNENGIKDIIEPPSVVQSFISHNAALYKISVIGDDIYITQRPSIRNLTPDDSSRTIFFDSGTISKPLADSPLTRTDDEPPEVDVGLAKRCAVKIRQTLGIQLFNIDVIVHPETRDHRIIDINAFPGYDDCDFFKSFLKLLNQCLDKAPEILCLQKCVWTSDSDACDSGYESLMNL